MSRFRKILFLSFTLLAAALLLEGAVRIYFALNVGPSVLLYGTSFHRKAIQAPSSDAGAGAQSSQDAKSLLQEMGKREWEDARTVVDHANELAGYSKYFPNQRRVDFDVESGERFEVTINRRGFRGRDFADTKKPGVIRVVTMGASSTFGYFARDDETYPYYLEKMLNDRAEGGREFEVINLGIPHLTVAEIRSLFLAEGLPLDPDVVTFMEGNNDARAIKASSKRRAFVSSEDERAPSPLILIDLISSVLESRHSERYVPARFRERVSEISEEFITGVAKLHDACASRGILFIVASQQENSQSMGRSALKGLTYEEELVDLRTRIARSERINMQQVRFLAHAVLMSDLRQWVGANRVPFVDVIRRLDQDRDVMVSWVHLSPRGNRMVAEALAEEILRSDSISGVP